MCFDGARWELDADALFAAPLTVQHFNSGSGPGSDTRVLRMICSFSPRDGLCSAHCSETSI